MPHSFTSLMRLVDLSFGSCWWVRDSVIQEAHPAFVIQRDRGPWAGHPTVSQFQERPVGLGLADCVQMLIGTSRRPKDRRQIILSVSDFTSDDKTTYFLRPALTLKAPSRGSLPVVALSFRLFLDPEDPEGDRNLLDGGNPLRRFFLYRNPTKPNLNEAEQAQLAAWLEEWRDE